jgi:glycosyltransferase involved in cell wall biosynthesis
MRILIAHSFYRVPGGEDRYVRQQVDLLSSQHTVRLVAGENVTLNPSIRTAASMIYSRVWQRRISDELVDFSPQVIHLHNPYPALGPSVHLAAQRHGIPLILTVHNFRLRCPNGYMYTEGSVCQRCLGGNHVNAVTHQCFPARSQAAAYAASLWVHRFILKLERKVDFFICPSGFMRTTLLRWGIPEDRIGLVRNFTDHVATDQASPGQHGIYVGRLSEEKGIDELLKALSSAGDPPFMIVGDGPAAKTLAELARSLGLSRTEFAGRVDQQDVRNRLRESRYMVIPSVWNENAPLAALEAMAAGRPLIVTSMGGLPELVESGGGISCKASDFKSLARAITRLVEDPELAERMGAEAFAFVQSQCTPEIHREQLSTLYERVTG